MRQAKGCRFIVIDEISLMSLENLIEISERLKCAMGSTKDFGGLHVLLAGDFYQLRVVEGCDIPRYPHKDNVKANKGRELWLRLNAFVELIDNCRAKSNRGVKTPLAHFCYHARINEFTSDPSVWLHINQRIGSSLTSILNNLEKANAENVVYICDTHRKIHECNSMYLKNFVSKGRTIHRIISDHLPSKAGFLNCPYFISIMCLSLLLLLLLLCPYYYVLINVWLSLKVLGKCPYHEIKLSNAFY